MNVGNSCFLSSAIQIFTSTSIFKKIITGNHNCGGVLDCFFCDLADICFELYSLSSMVNPKKLYKYFISKHFNIGGQNDAHEVYFQMIQLADSHNLGLFSAATTFKTQLEAQCLNCNFEGVISESTNTCQLILNLRYECTLPELIENYFCGEQKECPKCRSVRSAQQNNAFVTSPNVLQIYITKLDKSQKLSIDTSLITNGEKYNLRAALIHEGSLSEGHYTAIKWSELTSSYHLTSDLKMKELNSSELRTRLSIAIFVVYEVETRKRKLPSSNLSDEVIPKTSYLDARLAKRKLIDETRIKVERIMYDEPIETNHQLDQSQHSLSSLSRPLGDDNDMSEHEEDIVMAPIIQQQKSPVGEHKILMISLLF